MGMFSSAVLETRGQLQNPDAWFINMVSGQETASKVRVDEDTALSSTAIQQGVRFLGETIGSLPLNVHRRIDRGKELARDHSAFRLLHDDPNPELTSMEFREMLQVHTILGGTGFAIKVRDQGGTVRELWPVAPWRVEVKRDRRKQLEFRVRLPDEEATDVVPMSEMFWMRGFSRFGVMGESAIRLAREAVGLSVAAERYAAGFFGRGSTLSGVLENPNQLSDRARKNMYESWERKFSGLSSAHKVALLEEGTTFREIGVDPEKSQLMDVRTFSVQEASRLLNIPPPFLHDLSRATFSNIEALALWLEKYTVRAWLVRWEQALNKRVIESADRPDIFVEHVIDGLLRGDTEKRFKAFQTAINNGWMSRNEAREKENMNPIEGGDTYLVNSNLAVIGEDGVPQLANSFGAPDDRSEDRSEVESLAEYRAERSLDARFGLRDDHVPIFRNAAESLLSVEARKILEKARTMLRAGNVAEFLVWLEQFYREHREEILRVFGPILRAYARQIEAEINREVMADVKSPEFEDFVSNYVDGFANRHAVKSEEAIRAVVREAETEAGVEEVVRTVEQWGEDRAERLAESETVRGMGAFTRQAYIVAGATALVWRTRGENCPLCNHLNGMTVSIRSNFVDNGDVLEFEGASPFRFTRSVGHPPAHSGCDCGIGRGTI